MLHICEKTNLILRDETNFHAHEDYAGRYCHYETSANEFLRGMVRAVMSKIQGWNEPEKLELKIIHF